MADWTKAEAATRALEGLGVLAAGQTATAEDSDLAEEAVQSVYERLRKKGKAPFAVSAIPEWAQGPFRRIVAEELADIFGIGGEKLQLIISAARKAYRELCEQVEGDLQRTPVRPKWF